MFKKVVISLIIFLGLISFAQSENTWIKKKDKSEKIEKLKKKVTNNWIKKKDKKKTKKNKKKLKEKIKDSKSWITKKSKEKVQDIKEKLKKHKDVESVPNAELYFTAVIYPEENEDPLTMYGYINSDKTSEKTKKFKFKNKSFYSHNDGIAYFDDGKTTCQIDFLKGISFNELKGKAIIKCKNKIVLSADINFENNGKSGKGYDVVYKNRSGEFEIFDKKEIAKKIKELKSSSETVLVERQVPKRNQKKIKLNPNGKYYALLIGNSDYTNGWDDLISPVNDIRKIKEVFDQKYKFEKILTVENGTKQNIFDAFTELSSLTTTNDYVLIYYSGHGKIKSEQAYWIPTEGSEKWGPDWINISEIDIFLTDIKAHHLAVLVDSCFVGSKFKGMNTIDDIVIHNESEYEKYLQSALNNRSRTVLSSGTSGQVSDTVKGTNHSRFALSIINNLNIFFKKSYPLNLEHLAVNMKLTYTGFQKPMFYHPDSWVHGGGDFTFIPKRNYK